MSTPYTAEEIRQSIKRAPHPLIAELLQRYLDKHYPNQPTRSSA